MLEYGGEDAVGHAHISHNHDPYLERQATTSATAAATTPRQSISLSFSGASRPLRSEKTSSTARRPSITVQQQLKALDEEEESKRDDLEVIAARVVKRAWLVSGAGELMMAAGSLSSSSFPSPCKASFGAKVKRAFSLRQRSSTKGSSNSITEGDELIISLGASTAKSKKRLFSFGRHRSSAPVSICPAECWTQALRTEL